jgi:nucleoid-associated protein YgaU
LTTGTKIALAVIVLMVGLLVVYYGGGAILGGGESLEKATGPVITADADAGQLPDQGSDADAAVADGRTDLADNAAPVRPIDPLQQAPDEAQATGTLATDTPHRQSFIPFSEERQTQLDRPDPRRSDSGPAVVLPDSSSRAQLTSNQPAALSDRPGDKRSGRISAPMTTEYAIRSGDTLSSIAEDWFGDARHWDLIAKANPYVDPNKLKVGQKLRLPAKDSSRDTPRSHEPLVSPGSAGQYVVQSGDTLVSIARAYYGDPALWEIVFSANKAAIGDNPNRLKVGMRLSIPPAPKPAH